MDLDLQLTHCLEPGCTLPAEIEDRYVLESTDGPIEHVRIRCVMNHFFNCSADWLDR